MKLLSAITEWYRFRKVVRAERKLREEEQEIVITWKWFLAAFIIVIAILAAAILLFFFVYGPLLHRPEGGALKNAKYSNTSVAIVLHPSIFHAKFSIATRRQEWKNEPKAHNDLYSDL